MKKKESEMSFDGPKFPFESFLSIQMIVPNLEAFSQYPNVCRLYLTYTPIY